MPTRESRESIDTEKVFTRVFTQNDARFRFTRGMHCASSIINALC